MVEESKLAKISAEARNIKIANEDFARATTNLWNARLDAAIASEDITVAEELLKEGGAVSSWGDNNCACSAARLPRMGQIR